MALTNQQVQKLRTGAPGFRLPSEEYSYWRHKYYQHNDIMRLMSDKNRSLVDQADRRQAAAFSGKGDLDRAWVDGQAGSIKGGKFIADGANTATEFLVSDGDTLEDAAEALGQDPLTTMSSLGPDGLVPGTTVTNRSGGKPMMSPSWSGGEEDDEEGYRADWWNTPDGSRYWKPGFNINDDMVGMNAGATRIPAGVNVEDYLNEKYGVAGKGFLGNAKDWIQQEARDWWQSVVNMPGGGNSGEAIGTTVDRNFGERIWPNRRGPTPTPTPQPQSSLPGTGGGKVASPPRGTMGPDPYWAGPRNGNFVQPTDTGVFQGYDPVEYDEPWYDDARTIAYGQEGKNISEMTPFEKEVYFGYMDSPGRWEDLTGWVENKIGVDIDPTDLMGGNLDPQIVDAIVGEMTDAEIGYLVSVGILEEVEPGSGVVGTGGGFGPPGGGGGYSQRGTPIRSGSRNWRNARAPILTQTSWSI